jgi:hypothetical protein
MINYFKRKAARSALKILEGAVEDYIKRLDKEPDSVHLDIFNTGLKLDLKQAQKRALSFVSKIINNERKKRS